VPLRGTGYMHMDGETVNLEHRALAPVTLDHGSSVNGDPPLEGGSHACHPA